MTALEIAGSIGTGLGALVTFVSSRRAATSASSATRSTSEAIAALSGAFDEHARQVSARLDGFDESLLKTAVSAARVDERVARLERRLSPPPPPSRR